MLIIFILAVETNALGIVYTTWYIDSILKRKMKKKDWYIDLLISKMEWKSSMTLARKLA